MDSRDSFYGSLIDSIQSGLVAAAEIGGNYLLALDEPTLAACCELQGSCIEIEITDLDFSLYCHPGNWGIRLSRNPPAGEVDASICGRAMALVNLATREDKISTSMQEQVSFQGNVALAQKMQRVLANLDIDWEEGLSHYTGDLLAYQIHQRADKARDYFGKSLASLLQSSSEYLREEARLTPTRVEFEQFTTQLGKLRQDVERCQLRLQQLLDGRGNSSC